MTIVYRVLKDDESPLLCEAVLGNLNWCGLRFSPEDVRGRPEFAHYTVLASERGDFGVVAQDEGGAVGVVWVQYLSGAQVGFGFVDESTPELSLWVREGHRRKGVGRALMHALKAEALRRGVRRVSLSVEDGNFARWLYEDEGFAPVAGREAEGVMLWEAPTK